MTNTFQRCAARMVLIIPFAAFLYSSSVALAGPILGSAQSFAVLGASTVTNTGSSVINGDLGLWPGTSITGFGPGIVNGTIHNTDAVAQQAQLDALTAYDELKALPFLTDLSGDILGNGVGGTVPTLGPGVYYYSSSAQLTGTLTLDAQGNPNALFVFQIGTALTTASASAVDVIDGGAGTGVFWLLGVTGGSGTGSATLGTTTAFAGNILALDSITLNTGATILCGRAIALNAAVTLDDNTITDTCPNGGDFGSSGFAGAGTGSIPEPGTVPLLGVGLLALILYGRQSRKRVV
jgi:type VI secretion system secreted protein VgrG